MSEHEPHHAAPEPIPGSRAETVADARSRGLRTLFQGALSAILVAVATVVLDLVTPGTVIDWPVLAATAGTAGVTALAAFVQRKLEGH